MEELGHGPVSRLSRPIIKMGKRLGHQQEHNAVIYETALCAANRRGTKRKDVGLFGCQSLEDALWCLQSAPLLEDLAEWSHWSMVFEPEHGNLKAFLERNPGTEKYLDMIFPQLALKCLAIKSHALKCLASKCLVPTYQQNHSFCLTK